MLIPRSWRVSPLPHPTTSQAALERNRLPPHRLLVGHRRLSRLDDLHSRRRRRHLRPKQSGAFLTRLTTLDTRVREHRRCVRRCVLDMGASGIDVAPRTS